MTYNHIQLESSLDLLANRLHEGCCVDALAGHTLVAELQVAVTPGLVKHHQVHDLLALSVIEHCLCLAGNSIRQVKGTHDHACAVRKELEYTRLHLVLSRCWRGIINCSGQLESRTLLIGQVPLSAHLKIVA